MESLINKSKIYSELAERVRKVPATDPLMEYLNTVNKVMSYCINRTKNTISVLSQFTLHDEVHLFRVLYLMERLIGEGNIAKLSNVDLGLLVMVAFLHDIGMSPDEKLIKIWEEGWHQKDLEEKKRDEFVKFQTFCKQDRDKYIELQEFLIQKDIPKFNALLKNFITNYIRITHADRAYEIIDSDFHEIKYKDYYLSSLVAAICASHNQDAIKLLNISNNELEICGEDSNYDIVCPIFLGVILRLADLLDFDSKRTPSVIFENKYFDSELSLKEWNKHRSIEAWVINQNVILFSASCETPDIEETIREFCNIIDTELMSCNSIISGLRKSPAHIDFPLVYKLQFPYYVDKSRIKAKTNNRNQPIYNFHDIKFKLDDKQILNLLMGHNLYGNTEIALRELVQNSLDACNVRSIFTKTWDSSYAQEITIIFKSEKDKLFLVIEDNGIGMDINIIRNYFAIIGKSYYSSQEFYSLLAEKNSQFVPISKFGIGILSCFMISNNITIETKKLIGPFDSSIPILVKISGYEKIFRFENSDKKTPGTTITLELTENNPWKNLNAKNVYNIISKQFRNTNATIKLIFNDEIFSLYEDIMDHTQLDKIRQREWSEDSFFSKINIAFSNEKIGIKGNAIIGLIENGLNYVFSINKENLLFSKDNLCFHINTSIELSTNRISRMIGTIQLTAKGNFSNYKSKISPIVSISDVFIHGIRLGYEIYDNKGRSKNEIEQMNGPKMHWPFPIIISLNVLDNRRLNLNAARNQIINDNCWFEFQENLSYLVCLELLKSITSTKRIQLYKIIIYMQEDYHIDKTFMKGFFKAYSEIIMTDKEAIIKPAIKSTQTNLFNIKNLQKGQILSVKRRTTYNYGIFFTYTNDISEIDGLLHKSKVPAELWEIMKKDKTIVDLDLEIIENPKIVSERGGLVFGLPESSILKLKRFM